MKHIHYLPLLFAFFIFSFSNLALASVPEGISLVKTSQGYHVDFLLPDYQFERVSAEGDEYLRIAIPEYGINPEVGLPGLPLISFNLFISNSEIQPGAEVKNITVTETTLKNKIYPFQMPWEKVYSIEDRPFTINNDYYNSTGNMDQQFVQISEPFIIAGVKGVTVTIFPFRYNPKEDKLFETSSGSFDILISNPILPVVDKSDVFNQYLSNVFVNYEWTSPRLSSRYLIITDASFEAGMQQFVAHKISKGFIVDMFNTTVTGNTTTAIKNFIQTRYNDPSTKPEYILLVGDVAQIPAWTGTGEGSPKTDVNYVQLEGGDYFADAFLGRFSIANAGELQNAINKSVYMENFIGTLDKKNAYMSSTDNWQITEGTHNYVIDTYFGPGGYTNLKLYTHTYGATTAQLISALNANQVFAIYSGHGSETSWADGPPLNQQQVRSLTNTWYPFVYSFACVTGSYHLAECFGETWLRTTNGGSTFYGSTVNSYWDEDDILERRLIKAMFEDGLTRVTPMFDMAKIYLVNHYGGGIGQGTTTLRYVEMYNLMGDPSMPVVEMGPPCPIDPPANPNPPNGTIDVPIAGNVATWTNGNGATQVEVWFGEEGNLVEVYDGTLISSLSLTSFEPLEYNTTYAWQVKGKNDTCTVPGSVWLFTTEQDPNLVLDTLYVEKFESGLGGWTVTNDGGSSGCVWQIRFSPFPNSYTLPATSTGGVMTADVDECGSGSTLLSTATINQTFDFSLYSSMVWIEFDNDWRILDAADEAHVEISTNGGTTWLGVWDQIGTDVRNSHEVIDITTQAAGKSNIKFRLRSVQPGWDWWWALDNFCIYGMYTVPVELTSFTASSNGEDVELSWTTATENNNQGFEVERMIVGGKFEQIGYVAGFGTTTEPKAYSFVDSKLDAGNYLYRLKQIDFNGTYSYSEEVNVEIDIPLVYSLEQNYPNPFNPSTTIKYSIAEDGFVKLVVYNLLGEEVITLVNNEQKAGRYEVVFDASKLSSGVYMYRLESSNFLSIKKMLLVK